MAMDIIVDSISLRPDEDESILPQKIMEMLKLTSPPDVTIIRRSLDARKKSYIVYQYRLAVSVPRDMGKKLLELPGVSEYKKPSALPVFPGALKGRPVAVIGSGPAGLFCALRLIQHGAEVHVYERGRPVDERMKDISSLERKGTLDPESNVLFGEGGAGTYSDGKLTARTRSPESAWLFRTLVDMGAPSSILYEAKPHLGTDRLIPVLKNIRDHIQGKGSLIKFNMRIDDLIVKDNRVAGFITDKGSEHYYEHIFIAPGHSARDTCEMLNARGIALQSKPFAMGMRMEHPRELIDSIQYGNSPYRKILPSAEYTLTHKSTATDRGIYSFCMCPGGRVVNSSSEPDMLCVNGMSYADRSMEFSNAAVVVTVGPEDFGTGPLDGMYFQRSIEQKAFAAGGGSFMAPAQRITSFIDNTADSTMPGSSYLSGITATRFRDFMPCWMMNEIEAALKVFDRRMKGLITDQGLFIGVETRTSSPWRIVRDETFQSISHRGLYPIGEGAGYAGGIVSSAVDGIRAADALVKQLL